MNYTRVHGRIHGDVMMTEDGTIVPLPGGGQEDGTGVVTHAGKAAVYPVRPTAQRVPKKRRPSAARPAISIPEPPPLQWTELKWSMNAGFPINQFPRTFGLPTTYLNSGGFRANEIEVACNVRYYGEYYPPGGGGRGAYADWFLKSSHAQRYSKKSAAPEYAITLGDAAKATFPTVNDLCDTNYEWWQIDQGLKQDVHFEGPFTRYLQECFHWGETHGRIYLPAPRTRHGSVSQFTRPLPGVCPIWKFEGQSQFSTECTGRAEDDIVLMIMTDFWLAMRPLARLVWSPANPWPSSPTYGPFLFTETFSLRQETNIDDVTEWVFSYHVAGPSGLYLYARDYDDPQGEWTFFQYDFTHTYELRSPCPLRVGVALLVKDSETGGHILRESVTENAPYVQTHHVTVYYPWVQFYDGWGQDYRPTDVVTPHDLWYPSYSHWNHQWVGIEVCDHPQQQAANLVTYKPILCTVLSDEKPIVFSPNELLIPDPENKGAAFRIREYTYHAAAYYGLTPDTIEQVRDDLREYGFFVGGAHRYSTFFSSAAYEKTMTHHTGCYKYFYNMFPPATPYDARKPYLTIPADAIGYKGMMEGKHKFQFYHIYPPDLEGGSDDVFWGANYQPFPWGVLCVDYLPEYHTYGKVTLKNRNALPDNPVCAFQADWEVTTGSGYVDLRFGESHVKITFQGAGYVIPYLTSNQYNTRYAFAGETTVWMTYFQAIIMSYYKYYDVWERFHSNLQVPIRIIPS